MGIFIFLIGGAYFLYKYVEEEKGMGKKGGWTAIIIASIVALISVFIYRNDPDFSFMHPDGVIGAALMFASILTAGSGIVGSILGMNDKEFLKDFSKFLVVKFIVIFVLSVIVGYIAVLVNS